MSSLSSLSSLSKTLTSIRSFRNADVPKLLAAWVRHWSNFGSPPQLSLAMFEQAILARQFFDPSMLLVAESEGQLVGWVSLAASQIDPDAAVICALCYEPAGDEVAQQLLREAESLARDRSYRKLLVGLIRDQRQGYAGLAPIGHGIAVPNDDQRTGELLGAAGYVMGQKVVRMSASTVGYRPPVTRESMMLRRSSKMQTEVYIYDDQRQAAAMSHLDVESTRLLNQSGERLAAIKVWFSDPEAEVMSPSVAIIDLEEAHRRGRLEPAEAFLVGASMQSLQQRRITTAETAVDQDKQELISQMQRLQFEVDAEGTQWQKTL